MLKRVAPAILLATMVSSCLASVTTYAGTNAGHPRTVTLSLAPYEVYQHVKPPADLPRNVIPVTLPAYPDSHRDAKFQPKISLVPDSPYLEAAFAQFKSEADSTRLKLWFDRFYSQPGKITG